MDFIDLKTQYANLKPAINERIQRVLDHGQYILGPEVREMEERLAGFVGARHCVSVSSGTDALLIALMGLGVGPGDEVVVPSFTFVATAEVVSLVGATPVFVDVEPDTCNIDVKAVERAIGPATRAIIPVSLYGQVADMDELNELAEARGIVVIEDAAQSFGASYRGRRSGALSRIGCTSFFPSKPLGCYGDGGAIFTDDDGLAKIFREIRVHGQESRYYHTRVGVGGRMDTLQCAVVLAKLDTFEAELAARKHIGERYRRLLAAAGVELTAVRDDRDCVWAQFTVLVDERQQLASRLASVGVPTAVHYPMPLHQQPAYAGRSRCSGALTCSEELSKRVLSLPMHPFLDEKTQDRIVEELLRAISGVVASEAA